MTDIAFCATFEQMSLSAVHASTKQHAGKAYRQLMKQIVPSIQSVVVVPREGAAHRQHHHGVCHHDDDCKVPVSLES